MQVVLKNWYNWFIDELSQTKSLKIVSPFVNEQVIRKIDSKFDLRKMELVTRFSMRDFAAKVSSIDALRISVEQGANVFGLTGLHSKIYLFDKRCAVVTSANLTNGGLINNYECGMLLTDKPVIAELHSYFNSLRSVAAGPLTLTECLAWQEELAALPPPDFSFSSLPDYGASQQVFEADRQYFVKFFGSAKYRAPFTSTVKHEIERSLSHYACGFSAAKRPRQIHDGDIIYMARMTSPNNYAIFGKGEAIRFVDGRDEASKADIKERPWKETYPLYLRVKKCTFINGSLGDCVLLYDLIEALGAKSFPTTQMDLDIGSLDINPYRSLAQQPYVRLTETAVNWLEPRFQDCVDRFGIVGKKFISNLPKPRVIEPYL